MRKKFRPDLEGTATHLLELVEKFPLKFRPDLEGTATKLWQLIFE